MPRRFDHCVLCVRDLEGAAQTFVALGFTLTPIGQLPFGVSNRVALFGGDRGGMTRTFEVGNDGALRSRGHRSDLIRREPARPVERAQEGEETRQGRAAGEVVAGRVLRPDLEVADIFRDHGAVWRDANRGHVSLRQLKVMSAIERCRTEALGGHVARCENDACGHTIVAYNSWRDRHCPRCQGAASRKWLEARKAELLAASYFHVVYTLPNQLRDVAYQNKRVVYDLLMKAAAETTLQIAADPKHLGARIGITAVLHTWGSAMTHHPHVHMIVPGGGLSVGFRNHAAFRAEVSFQRRMGFEPTSANLGARDPRSCSSRNACRPLMTFCSRTARHAGTSWGCAASWARRL